MAYSPRRRGPNVSQYIANLNTVSPENPPADDYAALERDLSMFTNAEFYNFDVGTDHAPPPSDFSAEGGSVDANGVNPGLQEFHYPNLPFVDPALSQGPSIPPFAPLPGPYNYPLPTAPSSAATAAPAGPISDSKPPPATPARPAPTIDTATLTSPTSPAAPPPPSATSPSSAAAVEASSRAAAEEDKRRRNTAASARFRVKKKQREQALEATAREQTARADRLQARVGELERENKWLRGLLVEKAAVTRGAPAAEGVAETVVAKEGPTEAAREEKGVGTEAV